MRKKIRLKESDLTNIIRKIVKEQQTHYGDGWINGGPKFPGGGPGPYYPEDPFGGTWNTGGGGNNDAGGLGGESSQAPGMNMSQCTSACDGLGGSGEMCTSLCLDGEVAVEVEDSLMESYGISESRRLITEGLICGISCALRISGCGSRRCKCRRCKGKSDTEKSLEGWG
tara:strand:- start:4371 stop:4880 length:510 start_codon:yes stop_codon:yes gene_type:complete